MASITIRNLDDNIKKRLRKQAAENGRSMEEEAREILSSNVASLGAAKTGLDLFAGMREAAARYGGVDLEIPKRTPMRGLGGRKRRRPQK